MTRLEEIKAKYNISAGDLEEFGSALKGKLKESHPDNNKEYNSDYFTELNNDLTYVESLIKNSENQNTLVPMNEVLQTLAEIFQAPVKADKDPKEVLNEKLSANIQSLFLITKKHLRTFRIGSTTVTAIITFLWMFPNQIIEHPLIQMFFGDSKYEITRFAMIITVIWLCVLLYTIIIWCSSIRRERIVKAIMERLKLESVQNEIFMNFLDSLYQDRQFSKREFMKYLAWGLSEKKNQRKTLNFNFEEEMVQNMADIILLRAIDYGVIRKIKSHSLIDCYEIIQDEK